MNRSQMGFVRLEVTDYIESYLYRKSSLASLSGSQFIVLLIKLMDIACLRLIRGLGAEELGIISHALCKRCRNYIYARLCFFWNSFCETLISRMRSIARGQAKWSLTGPSPPDIAFGTGRKKAETSRMLSKSNAMGRAYAIIKLRINPGTEELYKLDSCSNIQLRQ